MCSFWKNTVLSLGMALLLTSTVVRAENPPAPRTPPRPTVRAQPDRGCVKGVACAIAVGAVLLAFPDALFGQMLPPANGTPLDSRFNLIKVITGNTDPLMAYVVLLPFAIERVLALRSLPRQWTAVQDAIRNLQNYAIHRHQYLTIHKAWKQVEKEQPKLVKELQDVITPYDAHLKGVNDLIERARILAEVKGNDGKTKGLLQAGKAWEDDGNFLPLLNWMTANRKTLKSEASRNWVKAFDDWIVVEKAAFEKVAEKADAINLKLQSALPEKDRPAEAPLFRPANPPEKHVPGAMNIRSDTPTKNLAFDMQERCIHSLGAVIGHVRNLGAKGDYFAKWRQRRTILHPVWTVGSAGAVIVWTVDARHRTQKHYGADPADVTEILNRKAVIKNASELRFESSLEKQLKLRREEMKQLQFYDLAMERIKAHEDELIVSVETYLQRHPGIQVNLDEKRILLGSGDAVIEELEKALASATQDSLGKEYTVDELIKFLAPGDNLERKNAQTNFFSLFYARLLDRFFPEMNNAFEKNDALSLPLRNDLSSETIPLLKKLPPAKAKDLEPKGLGVGLGAHLPASAAGEALASADKPNEIIPQPTGNPSN